MKELKEYEYLDNNFYKEVKDVLEQARKKIYRNIQSEMVQAYWQIGKMIVDKQGGAERAKYGDGLIKELSSKMTNDYGPGFNERSIRNMRKFYITFPIWSAVRAELSWTHYKLIISLDDKNARDFYIKEAIEGNWSTRQLEREIGTFSYQRYIASKGNHDVIDDTAKKEEPINPKDIIKDPYVLEFVGLKADSSFYEKDLESALITHLNEFLLELGNGFNNKVDYVITRCCGTKTVLNAFGFRRDICTDQLLFIDKVVDYKHWFFGHYHYDRQIGNKKTCLYQEIVELL